MRKKPIDTVLERKLINAGPSRHGWHKLGLVLRCPRLFAWNEQHPKPEMKRTALIKGSLVHQGLAHYYQRIKELQDDGDPNEWYEPAEAIALLAVQEQQKTGDSEWCEWVEFSQEAVTRYQEYWVTDTFKVVAVEKELEAAVYDEKYDVVYPYTQRADLIIKDKHGNISIVDHKTTARLTSSTVRRYSLSGQLVGYSVLGKGLFGKRFAGNILNMLELPKGFPDAIAKFKRPETEATPYSVQYFKHTIIHANRIINEYKDKPVEEWPGTHLTTGCFTNFGACDYHSDCQWGF